MLHRHQVPYKHIGQTSHHICNQKAQVAVGPAVPPHLGIDIEHVPRGHEAHGRQCKLHASLRPGQSHAAPGEHPQHHDGNKSQHAKVIAHKLQFSVAGFRVSARPLQRHAQRLALYLVCVLHVLTFLTKTNFFDKSAAKKFLKLVSSFPFSIGNWKPGTPPPHRRNPAPRPLPWLYGL